MALYYPFVPNKKHLLLFRRYPICAGLNYTPASQDTPTWSGNNYPGKFAEKWHYQEVVYYLPGAWKGNRGQWMDSLLYLWMGSGWPEATGLSSVCHCVSGFQWKGSPLSWKLIWRLLNGTILVFYSSSTAAVVAAHWMHWMQPGCDCGSGTGSSEYEGNEIEVLTTPSSFHTWLKHKNILTSLTKSFIGIFFGICNRSLMSDIMVIVSAKREGEGERGLDPLSINRSHKSIIWPFQAINKSFNQCSITMFWAVNWCPLQL